MDYENAGEISSDNEVRSITTLTHGATLTTTYISNGPNNLTSTITTPTIHSYNEPDEEYQNCLPPLDSSLTAEAIANCIQNEKEHICRYAGYIYDQCQKSLKYSDFPFEISVQGFPKLSIDMVVYRLVSAGYNVLFRNDRISGRWFEIDNNIMIVNNPLLQNNNSSN